MFDILGLFQILEIFQSQGSEAICFKVKLRGTRGYFVSLQTRDWANSPHIYRVMVTYSSETHVPGAALEGRIRSLVSILTVLQVSRLEQLI